MRSITSLEWTTEDLEFLRDVSMVVEGQLASTNEARSGSERIAAVSNAIIGAARMLQREDIRNEERSEFAKLIDAKSKLLVKLTT